MDRAINQKALLKPCRAIPMAAAGVLFVVGSFGALNEAWGYGLLLVATVDEPDPFFNCNVMSSPKLALICPVVWNRMLTPSKSDLTAFQLAYNSYHVA